MVVLSLFDGISCGRIALDRAGIKVDKYYASEIEPNAIKVTQYNYPDTIQLGDVRNIKAKDLPKIDLLIGGSPCQGFSFAGKQLNFNDFRSKLFFEYVRLLKEIKPKYFLFENVKMKNEYVDIISDYLGIHPIEINSSLFSAQNRKRLYWTNIENISHIEDKNIRLEDISYDKHRYTYLRSRGNNCGGVRSLDGKVGSITTSCFEHNVFVLKKNNINEIESLTFEMVRDSGYIRKITPNECELLQTLPIDYTSCISTHNRYKVIGNGWTVDVIAHIFKGLK
jgi:DNA (cytosine-5)-methyltransferase 3A